MLILGSWQRAYPASRVSCKESSHASALVESVISVYHWMLIRSWNSTGPKLTLISAAPNPTKTETDCLYLFLLLYLFQILVPPSHKLTCWNHPHFSLSPSSHLFTTKSSLFCISSWSLVMSQLFIFLVVFILASWPSFCLNFSSTPATLFSFRSFSLKKRNFIYVHCWNTRKWQISKNKNYYPKKITGWWD